MQLPSTVWVTKPHLLATNLIILDSGISRILPIAGELFQSLVSVSKHSPKQASIHRQGDLVRQQNSSTGVQIIFRAVCR